MSSQQIARRYVHGNVVYRQDAILAVDVDPEIAAEADREWVDDPSKTVGQRLRELTDLCCEVLRRHGYLVKTTGQS